ncbi:MAG: glycosyltransferase [Xanthomonadaceae bacterium]|nr:glycosyltransferase [Rhodospirillaceae bacterium]NIA17630.1 glycosyltransferase [Xanthomonadaceae bacterium]
MIYIILNNSPKRGEGVEQVIKNLVINFSDPFKKKILLICNDLNESENFCFCGIKCVNLKTKRYNFLDRILLLSRLSYSYKIYRFLKCNANDKDVINVHGTEYLFFTGIFKKKIKKIKIILTVHGSYFERYSKQFVGISLLRYLLLKFYLLFFGWYIFLIEKIAVKGADKFVFISEYFQNYYAENYKISQENGVVIHNGIKRCEKIKNFKRKLSSKFDAIIVGSAVFCKGLDIAIKVVEQINKKGLSLNLNIVGFSDFYKYHKKEKVPHYLKYIGRISPEKMDFYYQKSDFLLFPSRYEGFPLVILEALGNGLPIIVSKICKTNEIENHNDFGYIIKDAHNISEWVEVVEKMINLDTYNFFRKKINKHDFSKILWEDIARQYENLLSSFEKVKI